MNKKISLVLLLIVQVSFCMENGIKEGNIYYPSLDSHARELTEIGKQSKGTSSVALADSNEHTPLKEEQRISKRSAFKKKACELIKCTRDCGCGAFLALCYAGFFIFSGYALRYVTETPCEPTSSWTPGPECASETFWTAPAHHGHNTEIRMTIHEFDPYDQINCERIAQNTTASDSFRYQDMWWIVSKAAARFSYFDNYCFLSCRFSNGVPQNTTLKNSEHSYVTVPQDFPGEMHYLICKNNATAQELFEKWNKEKNQFAQVDSPDPEYLLGLVNINLFLTKFDHYPNTVPAMFDAQARNELASLIPQLPHVRCADGSPCVVDTIHILGCRDTSLVTVSQNATHNEVHPKVKKRKDKYKHRRRS